MRSRSAKTREKMGNPFRTTTSGCFVQMLGVGMVLSGVLILIGQGRITFLGIFAILVGMLLFLLGAKAKRPGH
jgi:hypothetical protein